MAKLYFYYSAMNAGKSTTLLQAAYNYTERGMDTRLFTPKIDDRHAVGKIGSRIGLEADATAFDDNFDFFKHLEAEIKACDNIRCIMIDEAQFLTKAQVEQLSRVTLYLNCPVVAYGLRSDFQGG